MLAKTSTFILVLFAIGVLLTACTTIGGPEPAARAAFDQFARQQGVPYKDVNFQTLKNDGTFATVRITASFRSSPQLDWEERYADIEVRSVGGQWQASSYMYFQLTEREQRKIQAQQAATATAWAIQQGATATAVVVSATATRQAGVKVTQMIKLSKIDNVEYIYEPTGCYSGEQPPKCKFFRARRITFSIENGDIASHAVEVSFTINDYAAPYTYYVPRRECKATPLWRGTVAPGHQQFTFVYDASTAFDGGTGQYDINTQFYLVSGDVKLISVDGIKTD